MLDDWIYFEKRKMPPKNYCALSCLFAFRVILLSSDLLTGAEILTWGLTNRVYNVVVRDVPWQVAP